MDEIISSRVTVAIEELISIQKQYVECREQIKKTIKEYLSELSELELQAQIKTELWVKDKNIEDNLNTIIDSYYGYICSLLVKNEDINKVADFIYIMCFNK